jgi:hypothetical protein
MAAQSGRERPLDTAGAAAEDRHPGLESAMFASLRRTVADWRRRRHVKRHPPIHPDSPAARGQGSKAADRHGPPTMPSSGS